MGALATFVASPVYAQQQVAKDSAPSANKDFNDIIVQARRVDERQQDVPSSSTVTLRVSPYVADVGELNLTGSLYYQSRIYWSEEFNTRQPLVDALPPGAKGSVPANPNLGQKASPGQPSRGAKQHQGGGLSLAIRLRNVLNKKSYQSSNVVYHNWASPMRFGAIPHLWRESDVPLLKLQETWVKGRRARRPSFAFGAAKAPRREHIYTKTGSIAGDGSPAIEPRLER